MLLSLTDSDGKAYYAEKTFTDWKKQAAKKAEKEAGTTDEWAGIR